MRAAQRRYSRALLRSGKISIKPLVTDAYGFDRSIQAFEYARRMKPASVKVHIRVA